MRLLLLVAFLCLPALAGAQQYPPLHTPPEVSNAPRGSVAVVVAIEDYLLLPDVPGAMTTANDWETFLRNGLGVDTVRVLVNQDASREEMMSFARAAADDVKDGADLWFVFVGHGAPAASGDDGVLVGVDAQQTTASLGARSLAQQELLATLNAGKQGRTIVIVDACFSGRTANGAALAKGAQPVIPVEKPTIDKRTVVLSAARAQEFAGDLPGQPRPAFSYLLLGALRGWADDGDGTVTADEAIAWTRMRLRGVSGRTQTPQFHGEGAFTLATGVRENDPGIDRILAGGAQRETAPRVVENVPDAECNGGQVRNADTAGHCCWPGQAWNGFQCVGLPSQCPEGAQVDRVAEACVYPECAAGKVRTRDGVQCCWPRQAWSSSRKACIGAPACPSGTVRSGESCLPDTDSDGIGDDADKCPEAAEDFDRVVDDDGCPDDDDGDGVADVDDKCPDAAEDDDDFETDGCPDPDNDDDEIADADDKCPNAAEDRDDIYDGDGCPEDDADADRVADAADRCPLEPEDFDDVDDYDGCAEKANGKQTGSYVVGGIGAGFLGIAAVPFAVGSSTRAKARQRIDSQDITQREVVDAQTSANASMRTAAIFAGAGGTLFVMGVIMWLTDADSPLRRGPETAIWLEPNSTGLVLGWRWR